MPESSPTDDAQLIARITSRDQSALSDMYQQYGGLVYSLASRVLGNSTLAEEVTQDTFLKVWNQAYTWDADKGKLVSWLLTITRYTAIDLLRREKRRPTDSSVSLDDILEVAGKRSLIDDPLWQDGRLLRSLIKQLPPEQIQVIELGFYEGMSHSEMAAQLKLPLGTVKTRVRLGLQKLKDMWIESVGMEDGSD
jgi:RNA polymerase sigma-70 factor, ECF subfamily